MDRNFWTKRVLLTCAPLAMTMDAAEASAMTFDFTGSLVTWTVPTTGVYDITAYGGAGGAKPFFSPGGLGAEAGVTLPCPPGPYWLLSQAARVSWRRSTAAAAGAAALSSTSQTARISLRLAAAGAACSALAGLGWRRSLAARGIKLVAAAPASGGSAEGPARSKAAAGGLGCSAAAPRTRRAAKAPQASHPSGPSKRMAGLAAAAEPEMPAVAVVVASRAAAGATAAAAGGGGSFLPLTLTHQVLLSGFNSGNGYVTINLNGSAAPEPSTWALMVLGFAGLGFVGLRRGRKISTPIA
jgi:hypothetical protein